MPQIPLRRAVRTWTYPLCPHAASVSLRTPSRTPPRQMWVLGTRGTAMTATDTSCLSRHHHRERSLRTGCISTSTSTRTRGIKERTRDPIPPTLLEFIRRLKGWEKETTIRSRKFRDSSGIRIEHSKRVSDNMLALFLPWTSHGRILAPVG